MSQIISFSADSSFAKDFDSLIERSGYRNRSRFIRDAALFFAEIQQRGDLAEMDEGEPVEGVADAPPRFEPVRGTPHRL